MSQFSSALAQFRSIISMLQMMDQVIELKQVTRRQGQGAVPGSALRPTKRRTAPHASASRRRGKEPAAPRFRIKAKIIIHKNNRYVKGHAANISKSGVFVCANRREFKDDEVVRVSIKPLGMEKYYKSIARVVRFNENGRYMKGYGLQFILPENAN